MSRARAGATLVCLQACLPACVLTRADPAASLRSGGSGCVTAALGQVLEQPAAFLMTDINPLAAAACLGTAHANGLRWADAVNCDLVGALSSRLAGRVDVLLFNPPYVVTPSEEIESR